MKYYLVIYLIGAGLLLSTSLVGPNLIGSDIHLEYYFAKQTLENGYNNTLPNSVNSALSVSLLAPTISYGFHIPLLWVFKVVYPLLYAFVPVILLYIYSRFMPLKWAFLASLFFIITPVFFYEMPQIARSMFTQLIMVSLLAVILSGKPDKWKWVVFGLGSLIVVVSHYSSATLWFVFLAAIILGYLILRQWKYAGVSTAVLVLSIGLFIFYTHWSSSSWQVEDIGNTVQSVTTTIVQGNGGLNEVIASANPVQATAIKHIGATEYMLRMALGLDFLQVDLASKLFRIIQILTEILLVTGIVVMLLNKSIPMLYKVLVGFTAFMLGMALIWPVIASTINPTRFYHLMLLIVSPGIIYGISFLTKKWTIPVAVSILAIYFVFTSGIVFQLAGYKDITKPTVPYAILFTNKSLDAGNYLTRDDDKAAEWAFTNGYKVIYGDVGGTLIAQDYYDNYHALPLKEAYEPESIILVRTWNTEHGFSAWVGPGLRQTVPLSLPPGNKVFESGNAYIWEVK